MLKIERSCNGSVVFSLSGQIEVEDVAELQRLFGLEAAGCELALDLQDVTLVVRDAVKFLSRCESENIRLDHCPAYIRKWIDAEESRKNRLVR
jgi:hypothetical protein